MLDIFLNVFISIEDNFPFSFSGFNLIDHAYSCLLLFCLIKLKIEEYKLGYYRIKLLYCKGMTGTNFCHEIYYLIKMTDSYNKY